MLLTILERGRARIFCNLCVEKVLTHIFRDSLDPPGWCLFWCVVRVVHPTKRIQHNANVFINTVLLPLLNAYASLAHVIISEHHSTRPTDLLVPTHISTDTQLSMLWYLSDYATIPMDQRIVHFLIPDPRGTSKQDENPFDKPGGRLVCCSNCDDKYKTKTHTNQPCRIPHTTPMDSMRRSQQEEGVWTDSCIRIWRNSTSINFLARYWTMILDSSMVQNLHRYLIKIIRNEDVSSEFCFFLIDSGFYHARM